MTSRPFFCELVSWDQANLLAWKLSQRIKESGFDPDLVVAIGRGGYVPARVICDHLLHDLLTDIKIEHWGAAGEKKKQAIIRYPLVAEAVGKKVLIVDDITDTGDTLELAVRHVRDLGAEEVQTAVLQHKIVSTLEPDLFVEKIEEWRWITYPWALHEDLVGLASGILEETPVSLGELKRQLRDRYRVSVKDRYLQEAYKDALQIVERRQTEIAGPPAADK